jgi:hypothetical protein
LSRLSRKRGSLTVGVALFTAILSIAGEKTYP